MNIRLSLFRASSFALLVATPIIFGSGSFGQVLNNFGYGYGYGYGETDELFLATIQKSILGKFYTSLNGDDWTQKDGWNEAASVCDWFGITCDSSGAITEISLVNNMLQGTLINDVWTLPSLVNLSLGKNQIVGTLPATLLSESLQTLDLSENKLSGELPGNIGKFPSLSTLSLQSNKLSGAIPDFSQGASNLKNLWLHENNLTGLIPDSISELTKLEILSLFANDLTGKIPNSLAKLTKLKVLQLGQNALSGEIPEIFSGLPDFYRLSLRNNLLAGNIPKSIGELNNLEYLYLDNNQLSGPIPDIFTNLTNLKVLSLSGNELSQSLPILSTGSSLERIDLSSNSFTGELDDVFLSLSNLKSLKLFDNNWTGPPPAWLSSLSQNGVTVVSLDRGRYAFTNVLPILDLEIDTSLRVDSQRDGNESAVVSFTSSDVDGVISSFDLYRNNELIYSDSTLSGTLTVTLISGINTLRFNVTDDRNGITTLEKIIRVSAPPKVQITAPSSIVFDTDGLPGEFVSFSASVQDIDGDGFTVNWYVNGVKRGSGINLPNILLNNGESEIEAMVIETGTELADRSSLLPFVEPPVYQSSSTWPEAIVGKAKNLLEFNNIAEIDVERGLMFACLLTVSGEAALPPVGVRFLLNLGAEITLTIDATRGFNPTGAFMEDGSLPTCSGIFDKSSGIYTDYIYFDGNAYELQFESQGDSNSFRLIDFSILN
jgi:Leucine-rich repeat (LRR) protein